MDRETANKVGVGFFIGFVLACIICMIIQSCVFDYGVDDAKSDVKIFNKTYHTSYTYQEWMFFEYDIRAKHNPFRQEEK